MANKRIDVTLGLSYDKTGLNSLQNELQRISASVKAMNSNNLTQGLKQAGQTAEQLDKILEKTFNSDLGTLNVTKFNQELAKSGMTLKSIKTDLSNYGNAGATAYNRMTQAILGTNVQLKQSNKLLDSMATTMMNTVKWGITSSIFNTITKSISKAYGYVKDLDSSLNDIRIVTGKSAEEMENFAEKANNAAKALGASTLDYSKASLIYYQQGLSDQEVQARAETTVKVANVTGQTGEAVSQELTAVWNGYKVSAEETEIYVDKLAAVAATTAADLEELSVGMSKVASAANAMGVDFDDLNAQIATIVSVTRQAPESVGTALKTIYARLGDLKVDGIDEFGVKLGEVSGQLRTMGIEILDQNGNMRDMTSVMTEVAEKWNTWTRAQQQAAAVAMAGKRQYNNLIALFENWDMYSKALETSVNSLGTLQNQQDIYMESIAAKLKELKATWQGLYQDLLYSKDINKGIDLLTEVVDSVDKVIKGFGGGSKAIAAFGAIFVNIFNKQISNAIIQGNENLNRYKNNLAIIETKLKVIEADAAKVNGARKFSYEIETEANTRAQMNVASKLLAASGGLTDEQGNQGIQLQQEIGALEGQIAKIKFQTDKVNIDFQKWQNNLKGANQEAQDTVNSLQNNQQILKLNTRELDNLIIETDKILKDEEEIYSVIEGEYDTRKASVSVAKDQQQIEDEIAKLGITITTDIHDRLSAENNIIVKRKIGKNILDEELLKIKEKSLEIKKEKDALDIIVQYRNQEIDATSKLNSKQAELNYLLEEAKKNLNITKIVQSFSGVASSAAMLITSINNLKEAWSIDSDVSIGDRIKQTLMSIGFLLPGVMNMAKSLPQIFSLTTNVASALTNVVNGGVKSFNALKVATNSVRLSTYANNAALIVAGQLKAKDNLTETEQALLKDLTSKNITKKIKALRGLNAEQLKNMGITEGATNTVLAYNAAVEGTIAAVGGATIAIAAAALAVMGLIYATTKLREENLKYAEEKREEIKRIREENEEKRKELEENNQLYNSYLNLYNQYKEGAVSKSEMATKTQELSDKLDKESIAVATLTGNYEYLAQAVEKFRKENFESDIKIDENIMNQNLEGARTEVAKYLDKYYHMSKEEAQNKANEMSIEDIDKFMKQAVLDTAEEERKESAWNKTGLGGIWQQIYFSNLTSKRKSFDNIINKYKAEYKQSEIDKNKKEGYLDLINSQEVNNLDYKDYKNLYEQASKIESNRDEILAHLDEYTIGNEQAKLKFLAIDQVLQNYKDSHTNLDEETLNKNVNEIEEILANLSNADFNKVITTLEVDENTSIDNIKSSIKIAQQQINQEDLGVVTSLRAKISSDKKLSKTEMKEALGEQEVLTSEYEVGLSDWDNQSQLDQVEILNDIVRDKIQIQWEYIDNIKEIAKEEKKIEEDRKKEFLNRNNEELIELRKKKAISDNGGGLTVSEEELKRLEELEHELDNINQKIEYWDEVSIKGLDYEDLNNITFDNLISGIDGLISETQVLADLVSKVGENWTIAGRDIQEFALNFPEVLAAQENFNYLQDGSIQLTEAGKVALQDSLNVYKEKIQAENEAYQNELQRQADIQLATAEMYRAQAQALDNYLSGKVDATKTEAILAENEARYENKLTETLGISNSELHNLMRQNGVDTTNDAQQNTQSIFDYWMSVGEAAAAASVAYDQGYMNTDIVGPSGKQSGGIKTTASTNFTTREIERVKDDFGMTPEQIAAIRDSYLKAAEAAENKASIYLSKKLGAGVNTQAMLQGMDNAVSGKGNGSSSGSSKSKEEKGKSFSDEFDRYWEYKKAIDLLDKSLSRLEKQQSKLHGKELIESLKKENELLEQQKANYDALFEAQKREAGELKGQLEYYGAAFKDNGELTNYADVTTQMLAQYTSAIQQYNAGALDEAGLKLYEAQYEDFKKALERYDTLYYSEMQDTMDKLDDARRKQLENNLKAWETEIQIKLDLTEAKRNWNNFVRDIEQDFRKIYNDLTIESLFDTKNFKEYNEDLNTTLQAIHDVENEIDKLSATGKSDMFQSMSEAQEKLKDLGDELIENGKNLYELYENIWDNYIDKLDQAADNLKDINDEFDHITTELEYEKKLIELIYGDKAYAKMDKFYATQQKNINAQLNSLKAQRDFWEQQFNAAYEMNKANHNVILNDMSTWTEDMRKAYDEMIDSQEKLNDMIIDGINNLTNKYLNKLAETFDKLEKAIWGMNLDNLKDDWDRITGLADEYLDAAEGFPQIQMLINKVNQGIDDTKDLKLQQKLAEFRDNEVQALMDKKDLTEDDLKLMEARYNIMLKEAALEDAQNAKNSMKLTRNSSGNWTYQYVADDTDVAEKQNDLLQSYQDLYKMADDAYQHAMELAMSSYETMQEKMKEIAEDTTITEEEKMIKIQEIQDTYLPMIQAAAENSELYRQEAIAATGMIFTEVCEQNEDAYEHLTDEQKILADATKENHLNDYEAIREAIVDNTYPAVQEAATTAFEQTNLNSSTVAADVIGQWAGDDGESVKNKLNGAIDDIEKNTQDFEDELNTMRDTADIDFTDVDTMIGTTTGKIEDMGNKTEDMVNRSTSQLELMRQYVNDIEVAFGDVIERVFEAISVMAEYTEATAAAVEEMNNLIITSKQYNGPAISGGGTGGGYIYRGGDDNITPSQSDYHGVNGLQYKRDEKGRIIDVEMVESTKTTPDEVNIRSIQAVKAIQERKEQKDWNYLPAQDKDTILRNILEQFGLTLDSYSTGGYTGEWDTSGKLAMLHQKELVLNEDDTENFLKATSLLNNISKINGNIEDSIMTSILNMMGALAPKVSGFNIDNKSNEVGGNVFNITAEFPNANDVSSIKEAILSLPNIASQYVHQRS